MEIDVTKREFEKRIVQAVENYVIDEENYDDNPQLKIMPATLEVAVVNCDEADPEVKDSDYYDVMDLVKPDPSNPGRWMADKEAVASITDEYFPDSVG